MGRCLDLLVIGGGVNGCGIARDAAGRGLDVGLVEMNDIGSATSASSTKLFHGGLRYLEYFEFRLVRESLIEREVLLKAMPHISWPMRFVLPFDKRMRFDGATPASRLLNGVFPWMKGRRPAWLIRLGLFLYDNLGGRDILPGARSLDLHAGPEGVPLKSSFKRAFEYSDCWVEDSRLVVLNARDAEAHGARIMTRRKIVSAVVEDGVWRATVENTDTGEREELRAKCVVNAAGPWVGDVLRGALQSNDASGVRLVRGSHIVTRRLFDHEKAYFFQGRDGRIVFAIPYETDFTLIGTTDEEHPDPAVAPICTPEERDYLIAFVNDYLDKPIDASDVVWRFSGVRPLFDDGADSATAATRDYVLRVDKSRGAPALNIFGGKITTYRRLAESALAALKPEFPAMGAPWTAGAHLPGGDFPVDGVQDLIGHLMSAYAFLDARWARRLVKAYGTEAFELLDESQAKADLGRDFGATLTEREVEWLIAKEYARAASDVVWRRSKLGLRMSEAEIEALEAWMAARLEPSRSAAAE